MNSRIFVISKNRPVVKTSQTLVMGGVPHKIVVEPQDVEKYVEAGNPRERLEVLPENDRGFSYVVNYCKNSYDGVHPVIILDDDIIAYFYSLPNVRKCGYSLKTGPEIAEFYAELDREIMETDFEIGTIGKSAFDWAYPDIRPHVTGPGSRYRYSGLPVVIIIKSLRLLEFDFDERLPFKSDVDYALKCMYLDIKYAKFVRFLQQTKMNKDAQQPGGLQKVYDNDDKIRRVINTMLARWPKNVVIDDRKKPINGIPELRVIYKKFDIDYEAIEV